jgi:hypothetical protein
VNLTEESKTFKMLGFPLNQLQTYYGYLCDLCPSTAFIFSDLNYTMVISLSQIESTTKLFLKKKSIVYHHPPHWDNVTAPHGRPNLRSRLHFSHNREGDHEVHDRNVVALGKEENKK